MFGRLFTCTTCEHTCNGGKTRIFTTTAMAEGQFYDIGDPKGLWLIREGQTYCADCMKESFPEVLGENVIFAQKSISFS